MQVGINSVFLKRVKKLHCKLLSGKVLEFYKRKLFLSMWIVTLLCSHKACIIRHMLSI